MSFDSEKDLERLLRLHPAARPAEGLADRIKAEIPPSIEVGLFVATAADEAATAGRGLRRHVRTVSLAAAVACLAVALGALGVRTVRRDGGATPRVALGRGGDAHAVVTVVGLVSPSPEQARALRLVAIEVTVAGPDDAPRPGARVAVERVGVAARPIELLTDRHGSARALGLSPGTYRLRYTPTPGVAASDVVTLRAGEVASLLLKAEPAATHTTPVG